MKTPKKKKMYNLVQYYGKLAVATLYWNLPYTIIRFKKLVEETKSSYPKGTYFKPELNEVPL